MLKKIFLIFILFGFLSCDQNEKISITKVKGSPNYDDARISSVELIKNENDYSFSFNIENYDLGIQTDKKFDYRLANSDKGQHIHFIVDNGPYSAHYTNSFSKEINDGSLVLAFLSRSYHESVKNPNAYILEQVGEVKDVDLSGEFLFYSRPKGTYKGDDTQKLLLDFYLVNTKISPDGNKVKATVQDKEFIIDEWAPYFIEGLPKGEITIKLELVDLNGNLIDSPFNSSERTVILE